MPILVGIDPGGTTGIAVYNSDTTHWMMQTLGPGDHHQDLHGYLKIIKPDTIVYEKFTYQRREVDKGVSLSLISVEYIGVIKLFGEQTKTHLVGQLPSHGACKDNNLWSRKKLTQVGLDSTIPHIRDATSHLLYYMTVQLNQRHWLEATHAVGVEKASE
jgi:hypothetical protein